MTDTGSELSVDAETVLTTEQLQRQEALWAAGSALATETAGTILHRGGSRTAPPPNALIQVAHFITTGGRDYLAGDLDRAIIAAGEESTVVPPTDEAGGSIGIGSTTSTTAEKSGFARDASLPVDPDDDGVVDAEIEDDDDPWRVHLYTSTYCHHGQHSDCRLRCKVCAAQCRCRCHEHEVEQ